MTTYQFAEKVPVSDVDEKAIPHLFRSIQHLIATKQLSDSDTVDVEQIIGREDRGNAVGKQADGYVSMLPVGATHKYFRLKWYSASTRLIVYLTNSPGEYPSHH